MSKPSGFYPQSPGPVFHQAAKAVRPSAWVAKESSSAFWCVALPFFPDWRLKVGQFPPLLSQGVDIKAG